MLSSPVKIDQHSPLLESLDKIDLIAVILRAMSVGESPIVAVHPAKQARTRLLDLLVPVLLQESFRVIQAMSLDGARIDLISLMDQVVGRVCTDPIERSEQCHAALTCPAANETRIALIVDDAHLLTDQTLRYLDLVSSIGRLSPVPLQIVLVGGPGIWDKLPLTGALAAEKVALSVALPDDFGLPRPRGPNSSLTSSPAGPKKATPGIKDLVAPEQPALFQAATASQEPVAMKVTTGMERPAAFEPTTADDGMAVRAGRHTGNQEAVADRARPRTTGVVVRPENLPVGTPRDRVNPRLGHRGRLALAACVGMLVVAGGVEGNRLLGSPLDRGNLVPSVEAVQFARLVNWFESKRAVSLQRPEADITATTQPTFPDRPLDNAIIRNARADGADQRPATAEQPAGRLASVAMLADVPRGDTRVQTPALAGTSAVPATTWPDAATPVQQVAVAHPIVSSERVPEQSSAAPSMDMAPELPAEIATAPAVPLPVAASDQKAATSTASLALSNVAPTAPLPDPSEKIALATAEPRAATSVDEKVSTAPAIATHPQAATSPATNPPVASIGTVSAQLSPAVVAVLVARGDELFATGDVTSARLMYQRAASSSAQAAITMGMTYDPRFLPEIGVRGIVAEPRQAITWYQRAAGMGSPVGNRLVTGLQGK